MLVIATPDLESRHYLQAWHYLRSNNIQPPPDTAKTTLAVINEAGLDTAHARICTEKGVAMDTLYITIPGGGKVNGEDRLRALEEKFNGLVARAEA